MTINNIGDVKQKYAYETEVYLLPRDLAVYAKSQPVRAVLASTIKNELINMRYGAADRISIIVGDVNPKDPYKVTIYVHTTMSDKERDEFLSKTRLLVDYRMDYVNVRGWKLIINSIRLSGEKIRVCNKCK